MNSLRSDNETALATDDDSPFIQRDTVTLHSKLPGNGVIEYWLSNCTASSVTDNITFITKFVCGKYTGLVNTWQLITTAFQNKGVMQVDV